MEDDFTDLQRLLRLKRHETPPPDFMEDFLFEFHQRQRAELLKRPLWRLALDRFEGALPTFQVQRYAYAGSFAAVVLLAGISAKEFLVTPAAKAVGNGTVAAATPQRLTVPAETQVQRPGSDLCSPIAPARYLFPASGGELGGGGLRSSAAPGCFGHDGQESTVCAGCPARQL